MDEQTLASGSIPHPIREDYPQIRQEKPAQKCRTLILSTIHHRNANGEAKSVYSRSGREIVSKDDPIIRTVEVSEQWVELNSAWIQSIGYLFLRNDGGIKLQVIPTEEQLKEIHSQIVEIGYKQSSKQLIIDTKNRTMWDAPTELDTPIIEPFYLIHLEECFQGTPVSNKQLYMRCQHGVTKVTMCIHPY